MACPIRLSKSSRLGSGGTVKIQRPHPAVKHLLGADYSGAIKEDTKLAGSCGPVKASPAWTLLADGLRLCSSRQILSCWYATWYAVGKQPSGAGALADPRHPTKWRGEGPDKAQQKVSTRGGGLKDAKYMNPAGRPPSICPDWTAASRDTWRPKSEMAQSSRDTSCSISGGVAFDICGCSRSPGRRIWGP
jgi:hypothetical protein